MHPFGKVFLACTSIALRAGLRRSVWIDTSQVDLMFLGYPFEQIQEQTESRVGMFSQHPLHKTYPKLPTILQILTLLLTNCFTLAVSALTSPQANPV